MTDETSNAIQAVSACLVAITAIVGLVFAKQGLRTWRDELRGRTEYELARRLLLGVYRVRDAVHDFRNSGMSSYEWADRPDRKEGEDEGGLEDMRYAYGKRWTRIYDARSSFDVDLLEAEVLWGGDIRKAAEALDHKVKVLWFRVFTQFFRGLRNDEYRRQLGDNGWDVIEKTVWRDVNPEGADPFAGEIAAIVAQFNAALDKHLRR